MADLNGDGKADIAVGNTDDNTVSVLLNHGDGTFAPKVDYATSGSPTSLLAADLNGDGRADLAAGNSNDNSVSVLLNHGDGTFAAQVDSPTTSCPDPLDYYTSIAAADLNGDGKLDLVAMDWNASTVIVLQNAGDGTFSAGGVYPTGNGPGWVAAADLNGDGRPDLALTDGTGVSVLLNTCTP